MRHAGAFQQAGHEDEQRDRDDDVVRHQPVDALLQDRERPGAELAEEDVRPEAEVEHHHGEEAGREAERHPDGEQDEDPDEEPDRQRRDVHARDLGKAPERFPGEAADGGGIRRLGEAGREHEGERHERDRDEDRREEVGPPDGEVAEPRDGGEDEGEPGVEGHG